MLKLFKKLRRENKTRNEIQKTFDDYNMSTLTNLYFPNIMKEIENRKKVERFFSSLS